MVIAIFFLITNSLVSGLAIIGCGTIINKFGTFFKILEIHKQNGFKIGFDTIVLESMNDMNNCIDSVTLISDNLFKIFIILYDIIIGNKYMEKDKNGNILILTKEKINEKYKNEIEELNNKVKKYESELNKIKNNSNYDSDENNLDKTTDNEFYLDSENNN